MKISVLEKQQVTMEKKVTKEVELELPKKSLFFKRNDDGNFFPRGLILFAITVKYSHTFLLFEVERGKQFYTDFVPTKDCRQEYWLTDTNSIRRTALKLIMGELEDFEEIEKEEFLTLRTELLDTNLLTTI